MRLKTTLALVASALLLASCGGGGSTTSTPAIDPLTLSLNLTGKSDNAPTVTSDTQLTGSFFGKKYVAGVLKSDKSVVINITPEMIATMPQRTYQKWKDSFTTCDSSKLVITKDAEYFGIGAFDLTVDGNDYFLLAGAKPYNNGTVAFYDDRSYVYAKGPVEMSGTVTCSTRTYTYTYSFKPGWNVVSTKSSYDMTNRKYLTTVSTTLGQGNVQTMDFVTYDVTQ